jgi:ribonuclease HII
VYYLGIDEAGRGPLIGNLFIVGILVDEKLFNEINNNSEIKDSKLLTNNQRNQIFNKFKEKTIYFVKSIEPEELDNNNLNELEAKYFSLIIKEALKILGNSQEKGKNEKKLKVFIDLPEKKEKFISRLKKYLTNDELNKLELILEHKADKNYKIVSLASIFAKTLREKHVKELKEKLNYDFGSGYPSDPRTKQLLDLLKKDKEKKELFKPFIRKKWKTIKDIYFEEYKSISSKNLSKKIQNKEKKKKQIGLLNFIKK